MHWNNFWGRPEVISLALARKEEGNSQGRVGRQGGIPHHALTWLLAGTLTQSRSTPSCWTRLPGRALRSQAWALPGADAPRRSPRGGGRWHGPAPPGLGFPARPARRSVAPANPDPGAQRRPGAGSGELRSWWRSRPGLRGPRVWLLSGLLALLPPPPVPDPGGQRRRLPAPTSPSPAPPLSQPGGFAHPSIQAKTALSARPFPRGRLVLPGTKSKYCLAVSQCCILRLARVSRTAAPLDLSCGSSSSSL